MLLSWRATVALVATTALSCTTSTVSAQVTSHRNSPLLRSVRDKSSAQRRNVRYNDTVIHANESYIINGNVAKLGEFPSFAYPDSEYCGATLIWPDVALSAGHCEEGFSQRGTQIYIGGTFQDGRNAPETIGIDWVLPHPDYCDSDDLLRGDLLLVFLKQSSKAKVARLNANPAVPVEKQVLTVVGHGQTEKRAPSMKLLKANLTVLNAKACALSFEQPQLIFALDYVCTSPKPQSACYGDSGGPLLDANGTLVGLVSGGARDCVFPDKPNRYTRISTYTDWIWHAICHYSANPPNGTVCDRYRAKPCSSSHYYTKNATCQFFGILPGVRIHKSDKDKEKCVESCHPLAPSSPIRRRWQCGPCPSSESCPGSFDDDLSPPTTDDSVDPSPSPNNDDLTDDIGDGGDNADDAVDDKVS
jgi:Trypsin